MPTLDGGLLLFRLIIALYPFFFTWQVSGTGVEQTDHWFHDDVSIICNKMCSSSGPFVYGLIDLFSDLCGDGGSWNQGLSTGVLNSSLRKISRDQTISGDRSRYRNSSLHDCTLDNSNIIYGVPENRYFDKTKPVVLPDTRDGSIPRPVAKLDVVEEETEDDSKSTSTSSSISLNKESLQDGHDGLHRDIQVVKVNMLF